MSGPLPGDAPKDAAEREIEVDHILKVRAGHGGNCSSIGSVIDTLYATATVGAAVFAAVVAALKREGVVVAGSTPAVQTPQPHAEGEPPP